MKILILAHGTLSVSHQELPIAAALKRYGHEIQVTHDINFGMFNRGILPEPLTESDIYPHTHGDYKSLNIGEEPDLVFAMDQSLAPLAWGVKEKSKKPTLCMFLDFPKHVIDEGSPVDYNPDYGQRYYQWLEAGLRLDNLIFGNSVACDEINRRFDKRPELVWYPLCNLNYINKIVKNVDHDDPYISSTHRFVAYKGTDYLIKALYGVNVKYKAVCVGGNLEMQISNFAKQILGDNFIYMGKQEEMPKLLTVANSMALCYPQISEWLGGLPPVEAMALRTPAICFDYGSLRELYGDCVIYAKPKDVDDLQEKIISVLNGDFDPEMLDRAEKRVYQYFTPDVMAANLTKVFERYV